MLFLFFKNWLIHNKLLRFVLNQKYTIRGNQVRPIKTQTIDLRFCNFLYANYMSVLKRYTLEEILSGKNKQKQESFHHIYNKILPWVFHYNQEGSTFFLKANATGRNLKWHFTDSLFFHQSIFYTIFFKFIRGLLIYNVSFRCTAKWFNYTHTYMHTHTSFFKILFSYRLSQNNE